mmetsp:Transcript_7179/g.8091  ORF Transcript_7179/g.8091 Transcript_7179/m.8091 type:complete len:243 (+) Transcript_7179:1090-1818(+)
MTQSFFAALASLASQHMGGGMNRGRGGYGNNQDYKNNDYRGGNNNYRGGRGRGNNNYRGGRGRGAMRGGPPGGHYQQRSQYEAPIMQSAMPPMMGMPPVGPPLLGAPSAGMPPTHAPSPYGMVAQPPMQVPVNEVPQQPISGMSGDGVTAKASTTPSDKVVNGFSLVMLQTMGDAEKENAIGTPLYNKLETLCGGETAGKITGMFLDLPIEEVFEIATDEEVFQKYYKDALNLIQSDGTEDS